MSVLYWLQLQLWGNGMANRQQLSILKQGALPWNEWRKKNPDVRPDLYEASLAGANLRGANLSGANLGGAELASADLQEVNLLGATAVEANLHEANLHKADLGFADLTFAHLSSANLTTARLWKADLTAAKLSGADLSAADLTMAMLRETDFSGANLYEAILDYAILVETNLRQANLTGCSVCGLSVWNVHLEGANQENLVITSPFLQFVALRPTDSLLIHSIPPAIIEFIHTQCSQRLCYFRDRYKIDLPQVRTVNREIISLTPVAPFDRVTLRVELNTPTFVPSSLDLHTPEISFRILKYQIITSTCYSRQQWKITTPGKGRNRMSFCYTTLCQRSYVYFPFRA